MSAKDEKEFRECFEMFDDLGEGFVKCSELSRMMTLLGWDPSKSELDKVLQDAGLRRKFCYTLLYFGDKKQIKVTKGEPETFFGKGALCSKNTDPAIFNVSKHYCIYV